MVSNVILMNELEEICDLRQPLEAAVGLRSAANKRYESSCDHKSLKFGS